MIKVYISGQISGLDYATEVLPIFKQAETFINSIDGLEAVNPIDNGVGKDGTWERHMKADIKLLCDCEQIYLLDNWQASRGARLEFKIAKALKIRRFIPQNKSANPARRTLQIKRPNTHL